MSKKSHKDRKDRDTWAYFRTNGPVEEISVTVHGDSVSVKNSDPKYTTTEVSYERDSGKPKRISTMRGRDGTGWLDFHAHLKINYQYLFGVDTNCSHIDGQKIAVVAIYHCPERIHRDTKQLAIDPLAVYLLLEPKRGVNPELIGWHIAITNHILQPSDGSCIGMVVDSEAGRLQDFNSRDTPYLGDSYLPDYVDLIYASADKKDKITNQIIRYCDKLSSRVIEGIRSGEFMIPEISPSSTGLYRAIAEIVPKNSKKQVDPPFR